VADLEGVPLPGIELRIQLRTQTTSIGSTSVSGEHTKSDEQGRFELQYFPNSQIYIYYSGEEILPGNYEFAAAEGETDLEVKVPRRCHFRIELPADLEKATRALFLDAQGKQLQVSRYQAGGMSGFSYARLTEGVSEVLSVSEAAVSLVIYQGETELHRMPIHLGAEGVTVLRP